MKLLGHRHKTRIVPTRNTGIGGHNLRQVDDYQLSGSMQGLQLLHQNYLSLLQTTEQVTINYKLPVTGNQAAQILSGQKLQINNETT